jgi:large subunit ribosomal protein L9
MEIILLERIPRLGQMGDTVRVKDGFARNYLLPKGKALRANEANRKRFESERTQLEARDLERRSEAEQVAEKLDGKAFVVIRSAGETGQLYGSVSTRDIAEILGEEGFTIGRNQVELNQPIKTVGVSSVSISLHGDVSATVTLNVARSPDEAERQAAGEELTSADAIYGVEEEEHVPSEEEFFEEGALPTDIGEEPAEEEPAAEAAAAEEETAEAVASGEAEAATEDEAGKS